MSDVEIHHPAWDRTIRVPADLWPGRLAAKGWELVGNSELRIEVGESGSDLVDLPPGAVVAAWNKAVAPAPPTEHDLNAQLDEKDQLRAELEAAGVEVDGRWGLKRLRAEAEAARDTEATE